MWSPFSGLIPNITGLFLGIKVKPSFEFRPLSVLCKSSCVEQVMVVPAFNLSTQAEAGGSL